MQYLNFYNKNLRFINLKKTIDYYLGKIKSDFQQEIMRQCVRK